LKTFILLTKLAYKRSKKFFILSKKKVRKNLLSENIFKLSEIEKTKENVEFSAQTCFDSSDC
jgi:hypothetical protein